MKRRRCPILVTGPCLGLLCPLLPGQPGPRNACLGSVEGQTRSFVVAVPCSSVSCEHRTFATNQGGRSAVRSMPAGGGGGGGGGGGRSRSRRSPWCRAPLVQGVPGPWCKAYLVPGAGRTWSLVQGVPGPWCRRTWCRAPLVQGSIGRSSSSSCAVDESWAWIEAALAACILRTLGGVCARSVLLEVGLAPENAEIPARPRGAADAPVL